MKRIGVVDTTFARVDMARYAVDRLKASGTGFTIERRTVPGIKDLPVAVRQLFHHEGADLCLALGMPGKAEYDRTCAHEASLGLLYAGVLEAKPVVECFVFEGEADGAKALETLARRRAEEHAENAYAMLYRPRDLARRAGTGLRQGFDDAGPVRRRR
ncbi:MAG TPA: riboflavin synthase [Thermoplasmata archaeon]|nr:riboflavin synthase [Thermoplasmata archaeon]HEV2428642.1 riboflavin synthase [Thermoplasmata archaeon]